MNSKIFAIDGRTDLLNKIIGYYSNFNNDVPLLKGTQDDKVFSDGEISISFEESVRSQKTYLICTTNSPTNILKLQLAADAAKRASASEIIAIIPYFGYSRQDRKDGLRGAVGGKVIANALEASGINHVVLIDLHADQLQGFFNIAVDHIEGHTIFLPYIENLLKEEKISNVTLCSPDAGGVKRVDKYYKKLSSKYSNIEFAMISKKRDKANSIESMDLIGDVKGREVIIIDDMIDTAGTLSKASILLLEKGAKSVRAIATHGIFSGKAFKNLDESNLTELILADTYAGKYKDCKVPITVLSAAENIARIINASNSGISASASL